MQTIRVTGKGILQIKPDTIRLLFSASEQEKTYDEAVKKSAAWTKKLEKLFLQLGFEKDDLKTTSMNIEGRYDWDKSLLQKRKRILVGYEYDLHMMIKFPADNERLGKIIYFLSHSKLKPSFQIEYTVDDQEKAKEDLLALAVEDAKRKAEILTSASGQELVKIMNIDYSWGEIKFSSSPIRRFMPEYDDDCYYDDDCDYEESSSNFIERRLPEFLRKNSSLHGPDETAGFEIHVNPDSITVENKVSMVWQIQEAV